MDNNLERFIEVQKKEYHIALSEIKNGYKVNHWMWYIFPQLKGLGTSAMSEFYGIEDFEEAKEYYNNEYLKNNLLEISNALLELDNKIENILGIPDNLKLQSCMTLFELVDSKEKVFKEIIDKFYDGKRDLKTINLLKYMETKNGKRTI